MKRLLWSGGFLLLTLGSLWSQAPSNPVAEIHVNVPKPGMTAQYEEGRKRHMQWHASQKDPWTWYVWEIITGPSTGSFVVGTLGHAWKDFDGRDTFQRADTADAAKSFQPHLGAQEMSYWIMRADLSTAKEGAPGKFLTVTHFWLDPAMGLVFTDAVKKVRDAIEKTKYAAKPSRWYQLANGGDGPHYVLVSDRTNMADMEPLPKTIDEAVAEAYGQAEGKAVMDSLRKSVHRVRTELLNYRADLSHVPK